MKYIEKKINNEPYYLTQHREQIQKSCYNTFTNLKDSSGNKYCKCEGNKNDDPPLNLGQFNRKLLDEQGHICCYCMRKIPDVVEIENYEKRKIKWYKMNIEHWYPQSGEFSSIDKKDIQYTNMYAACSGGGLQSDKTKTCGAKKLDYHIVLNPSNNKHIKFLKYTSDGKIFCIDIDAETLKNEYHKLLHAKGKNDVHENGKTFTRLDVEDLNEEELKIAIQYDIDVILNLNEDDLIRARNNIYKAEIKKITEKYRTPNFFSAAKNQYLNSLKNYWSNKSDNKYKPFCMVAIFVIEDRLKLLQR